MSKKTVDKKTTKKPQSKGRSVNSKPKYKWDVVEAEKLYLSDASVSYSDIAKKYGVALTTVKNYGKAHDWPEQRQRLTEKGLESFAEKHAALISETNDDHLRIFKNSRNIAYNNLVKISKQAGDKIIDVKELSGNISAISEAVKSERMVLGLPTLIQQFGPTKDVEEEEATWATILTSVEEARKAGLVDAKPGGEQT